MICINMMTCGICKGTLSSYAGRASSLSVSMVIRIMRSLPFFVHVSGAIRDTGLHGSVFRDCTHASFLSSSHHALHSSAGMLACKNQEATVRLSSPAQARKPGTTPAGKLDEFDQYVHPDAEKEPLQAWPDGVNPHTGERGGPKGPEPTRYGDWERKGRVSDF
ncbi:uncharacterized protein LOC129581826 isoform X2 [Paramacrobiotus metropolitanus]|uniref:uncharacterized protein LOC129581826 isoform X2 n=1 Tax=Paramacrobiotus metropolitanus TaxID=2943436 RepID=UPI002445E909|nr:uncharacterized protein LOC129581826 isoform X2 [Paramacrobiotus metropolitanus]